MRKRLTPEEVPAAIQTICEGLGISQAELARRLGTYAPTVNRWATGKMPPHRLYLRELEKYLRQAEQADATDRHPGSPPAGT